MENHQEDRAENIGKIGEYLVQKHLLDNKYHLAKFDMYRESKLDSTLPQLIPTVYSDESGGFHCEKDKSFYWREQNEGYSKWLEYSLDKPLGVVSRDDFYRANLIVQQYINSFHQSDLGKEHRYIISKWNGKKLPEKVFSQYNGHPGRYDMIGYKKHIFKNDEIHQNLLHQILGDELYLSKYNMNQEL